ncbi:hypothetical protein [Pararhizobium sp.]|uniref:hypothetical protein n=1 Tax=Pararhizobium sp. TaxID=1977563 RepID=UPI00271A7883|nr:hypothetical protein [Pararhizobium sp.]MDO9416266.1 hypothetical protein [Pararhizobium sp.]
MIRILVKAAAAAFVFFAVATPSQAIGLSVTRALAAIGGPADTRKVPVVTSRSKAHRFAPPPSMFHR